MADHRPTGDSYMQKPTDGAAAREPLILRETPDAPIACDMTQASDTLEERLAEYRRLFAHALTKRGRTTDAVEFRFASKPGVADWVVDLVRREAACCPFFSYHVSFDADHVTWWTSSHAGSAAQTILDEFHALPERFAEGVDGFFERLEERGVLITSPAPGRFVVGDRQHTPGLLSKVKAVCGC